MVSNIKEIQRKKDGILRQKLMTQQNMHIKNKKDNEQLSTLEKKRNSLLFCQSEQHNHKEDIISNNFEYSPEIIKAKIGNFEDLPLSFSLL